MTVHDDEPDTLCAAFQRTVRLDPSAVALRTPDDRVSVTWAEYDERVRAVAAGLGSLGIGRGDTVGFMMGNRADFFPLDVGAQHLGATCFSIYTTLPPHQIAHVLENSGARVVICEARFVEALRSVGSGVEHLICIDGAPPGCMTLDDLLAAADPHFDFDGAWRQVRPEDVATLIYTSGTTGQPKGVETTHASLVFEARALGQVLGYRFGDRVTSFLPAAHIADRYSSLYVQEYYGTQVSVIEDATRHLELLPLINPTIWGAVPRGWQKLKAHVEGLAAEDPALRRALSLAQHVGDDRVQRRPTAPSIQAEYDRAREELLDPLMRRLGLGEVRWANSGGAPIPASTLAFFSGVGIPITEIWGMSELSCIGSTSAPVDAKLGSVGRLLPGMEGRIAEDGELLVRGPLVMRGYRKNAEATQEAVDEDGWLHTGDVMRMDEDGFLFIVDRKKDIMINASGKNMSPAHIENALKAASSLIANVVAVGEGRAYNTALIALDPDEVSRLDPETPTGGGLSEDVLRQLTADVARGNAGLARVEQVKRFTVVAGWLPGGDEITMTQKVKRGRVLEKYADLIERMYAEVPPAGVTELTARPFQEVSA